MTHNNHQISKLSYSFRYLLTSKNREKSEATCIPLETIYRALLDDFPFTVNYFALLRNAWLFVNTETGLLHDIL